MKQHAYLVAYQFQREGYFGPSFGTSQIYRNKKIKSFEDIDALSKYLTGRIDGASNLSIYNFIYLGRHKMPCNEV